MIIQMCQCCNRCVKHCICSSTCQDPGVMERESLYEDEDECIECSEERSEPTK